MVDYGRKWCHFSVKNICKPTANSLRKCLILFVTVLFIVEEWINQFALLRDCQGNFVLRFY